jgi:hypothetical protein
MRKEEEKRWRTVVGGGDDMREIRWREKGEKGKKALWMFHSYQQLAELFSRRFLISKARA